MYFRYQAKAETLLDIDREESGEDSEEELMPVKLVPSASSTPCRVPSIHSELKQLVSDQVLQTLGCQTGAQC